MSFQRDSFVSSRLCVETGTHRQHFLIQINWPVSPVATVHLRGDSSPQEVSAHEIGSDGLSNPPGSGVVYSLVQLDPLPEALFPPRRGRGGALYRCIDRPVAPRRQALPYSIWRVVTGRHARQLASHGCHVLGIDLSADSIRAAKKRKTELLVSSPGHAAAVWQQASLTTSSICSRALDTSLISGNT